MSYVVIFENLSFYYPYIIIKSPVINVNVINCMFELEETEATDMFVLPYYPSCLYAGSADFIPQHTQKLINIKMLSNFAAQCSSNVTNGLMITIGTH